MQTGLLPVRVIIADDHPGYREGLHYMIRKKKDSGVEVTGEASDGKELIRLVEELQPDVVITDIKMPVMDGIAASRAIRKQFPSVQVLALSMFDEESLVIDMMETGAKGYILKNADKDEVIAAIRSVSEGSMYLSRATSKKLLALLATGRVPLFQPRSSVDLTEQDTRIIKCICRQLTSKEMAAELQLSHRTVEDYRARLQEKVGAKCAVGVAVFALKHGIVSLSDL